MKRFLWIVCIIWLSLFAKQSSSLTVYYGDPAFYQKLVTQAVEGGFVEVKTLIDRQFWFMLREAKFDKYSFKIKSDLIEYKVNYTSVDTVYEFEANLSKFSWKPQIVANRKYQLKIEQEDNQVMQDDSQLNKNSNEQVQNKNQPKKSQSQLKPEDTPKQSTQVKITSQTKTNQSNIKQGGSIAL